MDFSEKTTLGRTGLQVGRLGISSSFGSPAAAFEEAFENRIPARRSELYGYGLEETYKTPENVAR